VRSTLGLATSILAAGALAAGAAAIKLPPPPSLPAGWSHASINVVVRHVPHTFTYDRGRVAAVSPTSLTLREPDGSVVTIAIDSSTIVRLGGREANISEVRRLDMATTVTVDGGPAALVKVQPRIGR